MSCIRDAIAKSVRATEKYPVWRRVIESYSQIWKASAEITHVSGTRGCGHNTLRFETREYPFTASKEEWNQGH